MREEAWRGLSACMLVIVMSLYEHDCSLVIAV